MGGGGRGGRYMCGPPRPPPPPPPPPLHHPGRARGVCPPAFGDDDTNLHRRKNPPIVLCISNRDVRESIDATSGRDQSNGRRGRPYTTAFASTASSMKASAAATSREQVPPAPGAQGPH